MNDSMNQLIRKAAGHGTEQPVTEADGDGEVETEERVPDFDGGARRTSAKATDMNAVLRAAVDRR